MMVDERQDQAGHSWIATSRSGFTLLELLVAVAIIALLVAVLLPGLAAARGQAKSTVCRSNIRQIMSANEYYAQENEGLYIPGAADFLSNLHRWHGSRDELNEAFDSSRGPLAIYLGPGGEIRRCPTFDSIEVADQAGGFERGNGGYGYNNAYIGVNLMRFSGGIYRVATDLVGVDRDQVTRPVETVMFTDSAFARDTLIEYSFAEPRFHPQMSSFRADPSIHFRHRDLANVGWCDGHVDAQRRTFTHSSGLYKGDPKRWNLGWFGERDDNSLFDLR